MSIEIDGLTKRFGDRIAVDDLSLRVPSASIFGFLGPNGSGKTTTIRMLLGIVRPDAGTIRLCGSPVDTNRRDLELKRLVGAVSENQHLYDDMTSRDYLEFFAGFYRCGKARVDTVLEDVGLIERAEDLAINLSKGLQQKLGLARALLHDPPVLILDEPVSGLDPHGIRDFREIIVRERSRGRCIFLSSHVLSEVERTADRVAIMSQGRLLLEDETPRVAARLDSDILLEIELDSIEDGLLVSIRELPFVTAVTRRDTNRLEVRLKDGRDARQRLSRLLNGGNSTILGMQEQRSTLEDVFMTMTGKSDHVDDLTPSASSMRGND